MLPNRATHTVRRARPLLALPMLALAACNAPGDLSGPAGDVLAIGAVIASGFAGSSSEVCYSHGYTGDIHPGQGRTNYTLDSTPRCCPPYR